MKKVLPPILILFFLTLSSHADFKKNLECRNIKDFLTMELPKSEDDCIISSDLQKYISCRDYYGKNIEKGLNADGENSKDHYIHKYYKFFDDTIKKVLTYELKKVKNRSIATMCTEDTLFDFQGLMMAQDLCYGDPFISAFPSDMDMSKGRIKLDYFASYYDLVNAHLESKPKPKKKAKLCGAYLECLSAFVHSRNADVDQVVKNLYHKTMRECSPGYYNITTTIERKEESRQERLGDSMVSGPRTFITTNIVETKSKQLMYIDSKKGRVVMLPLKDQDASRANLQSYKFDEKSCSYHLVTDTQIDKHIRHKQVTVIRHDIGLVDDDKATITLQVRDSVLKKELTINFQDLESTGHVLKSGTFRNETQRHGGISFGKDYTKKQDKAASIVLENIPLGKNGQCQVKSVHDGFIGEGPSQFDISFKYYVEINKADFIDIEIFKSSSVRDHWEYRAIKKKEKKPSQFEEEPNGILDIMESQMYNDLSQDDKQKWDDVADSQKAEDEFEGMTIDDLQMYTD